MACVCVACGQDLSAKRKYEKVTLRSLPPEIISVWEELLKTQESSINPQNLLDDGVGIVRIATIVLSHQKQIYYQNFKMP